jgi:4-hydroxybutyrate dehydrogenase/sulfolactaldehyde 3-reductase
MALNLLKGGHALRAYDVDEAAVQPLAREGATACASPAEAATGAEIVITMLPNGDLVRQVIFGERGVLTTMARNALVIDMSTIHPHQTDDLIKRMAARGLEMMDVPVGRTSDHAVAGTLLLLAGGTPAQIERARPVLMLMGSELVNAGGPGKGIRVKIVNNYMSISLNALSAEATTLCEALGLKFETALEVMKGTPANKGHFTTTWPGKVLRGDLTPAFNVDLAHKDLGLALDVANKMHTTLPMGAAARETYNQARAKGRGQQDWTAILEHMREVSGLRQGGAARAA